jgi:MoxR-like ATPase
MQLVQKFQQIEAEINNIFMERHDAVHGLLIALLAKKHLLMLGPPGTAKSQLAREASGRINSSKYFEYLLTRFTTPEEIFGPFSLKALENDHYMRLVKDKLPECHIAFIDEVYKGSSAIANTLLTAINERIFHNDGKAQLIPLQTMIGASNELPSESEELAAFHDRFLLKYEVKYIFERGSFMRMLKGDQVQAERTTISIDELKEAQDQVKQVKISEEVRTLVDRVRFELQKEGIIVSDRVFNTSQDLIRAEAWLMGLTETIPEAMGICQHAYWDEPKKSRNVKMTVLRASSKEMLAIEQAYEEAQDLIRVKTKMDDETSELKEGLETRKKLQKITKILAEGIEFFEKKKLPTFKYKSMLEAARFRLQTIDADLMGSDMEEITKKGKGKNA